MSDDDARAAVDAAWDGGIRTFDTAPHYGLGLSERRLGDALRHRPRDEYVISTKVGRLLEPGQPEPGGPPGRDPEGFAVPARYVRRFDFSADGVRRSLEASLDRLGLDRVDIALIHDPDDHGEQALREAYPALEKLRAEGAVGAIGVGMNQAAMLTRFVTRDRHRRRAGRRPVHAARPVRRGRAAARGARARGVSVIAGGVFNSGLLAAPVPGATYDYQTAPGRTAQPGAAAGGDLRAVRRAAARRGGALPAHPSRGRQRADRRPQRGGDHRRDQAARA